MKIFLLIAGMTLNNVLWAIPVYYRTPSGEVRGTGNGAVTRSPSGEVQQRGDGTGYYRSGNGEVVRPLERAVAVVPDAAAKTPDKVKTKMPPAAQSQEALLRRAEELRRERELAEAEVRKSIRKDGKKETAGKGKEKK